MGNGLDFVCVCGVYFCVCVCFHFFVVVYYSISAFFLLFSFFLSLSKLQALAWKSPRGMKGRNLRLLPLCLPSWYCPFPSSSWTP